MCFWKCSVTLLFLIVFSFLQFHPIGFECEEFGSVVVSQFLCMSIPLFQNFLLLSGVSIILVLRMRQGSAKWRKCGAFSGAQVGSQTLLTFSKVGRGCSRVGSWEP